MSDAARWTHLAAALGLVLHTGIRRFAPGADLRRLERSAGDPAAPPFRTRHWLCGTWRQLRALVVHHVEREGEDATAYTTAVVAIDPPLLLGASIERRGWLAAGGLDLGLPYLRRLVVHTTDPTSLRELLLAQAPSRGFLARLGNLIERGYRVTDSTVSCSLPGIETDPAVVRAALDECAALAVELATRRAALPITERDAAVRREWRGFANGKQLAFDERRMRLRGSVAGATIEVAIESHLGGLHTTVGVGFPSSVGIRLEIRKTTAVPFLSWLFGQDLKTGDRAFDGAFVVRGEPARAVRRLFESASLRAALVEVAGGATELSMTQHGMFWAWPEPILERAVLEHHVGAAVSATRAIFGSIETSGPYR